MAVTRSRAAERTTVQRAALVRSRWRMRELVWTLAAGLLVAAGLFLVYRAKTRDFPAASRLLNLNGLSTREDLLPVLNMVPDSRQRQEAARRIYYLSGGLPNVGAVARTLTPEQFRQFKPLVVVRR